jgi:hypothetical protein
MKLFLPIAMLLCLVLGPAPAMGLDLCDLQPLMDRFAAIKTLNESTFAADFQTQGQRRTLYGYKRLLMECQERIKATVQMMQLYNIFAAEEGLEATADFISERIALQLPQFIELTLRDVADINGQMAGVSNAELADFGRSAIMQLNGYVNDINHVSRQLCPTGEDEKI